MDDVGADGRQRDVVAGGVGNRSNYSVFAEDGLQRKEQRKLQRVPRFACIPIDKT